MTTTWTHPTQFFSNTLATSIHKLLTFCKYSCKQKINQLHIQMFMENEEVWGPLKSVHIFLFTQMSENSTFQFLPNFNCYNKKNNNNKIYYTLAFLLSWGICGVYYTLIWDTADTIAKTNISVDISWWPLYILLGFISYFLFSPTLSIKESWPYVAIRTCIRKPITQRGGLQHTGWSSNGLH